MVSEVKEKLEVRKTVSMSLSGIPQVVHKKIINYRRSITAQRGKDFSLKEAYVEYLIEKSRSIK